MGVSAELFHDVAIAGFIVLGGVAVRAWLKTRTRATGAVAAALGSLGLLAIAWVANDATDYSNRILSDAAVAVFLASGYGISAIRNALVPVAPRVRRVLLGATVAVGLLHWISRPPMGEHPNYSVAQMVVLWLVVAMWAASAAEPVVTFVRIAPRLPAVQRARVRTLAMAISGLVILIVFYAWTAPHGAVAGRSSAISIAGLLLFPLLWVAFSPPPILRRLWRAQEEEASRRAIHDVMAESHDRRSMAAIAIEWAVRLLGADGGTIVDADGAELASTGPRGDVALAIGRHRHVPDVPRIVVPIAIDGRRGALVVVGGAFTPVFGSDELARLEQWAGEVALAIDRVTVLAELRTQTRTRESMLRAMSDLGEGVVVGNSDKLVYVNDAYCAMVGYSRDEVLSLDNMYDIVHPDDRKRAAANALRRRSGLPTPDRYDLRLIRKDGDLIEVEVAVKPYEAGGKGSFIGIFRDITARKRAVAAARESETRAITAREALARETTFLRLLQDVAAASNETNDVSEALQLAVDLICRRMGLPLGHVYLADEDAARGLVPTAIWRIGSDARYGAFRTMTEALRMPRGTGLPGRVLERKAPVWFDGEGGGDVTPGLRFSANVGIRSGFAFPVLASNEVVAVLEFFSPEPLPRDDQLLGMLEFIGAQIGRVFERARAGAAIEQREAQLTEAQAIASIGSWEWTIASNHVTWSAELYRIFGLDESSFGATLEGFLERVHPDDRERARATVERALHERSPFTFDHRIIRPDGTVRVVHARGEIVLDDFGVPARMVGTGQDVTEQRRIEDTLRSAYEREREALDRMRKLDEMKSAILTAVSHELRTPLTVILGFAQTLQRDGLALTAADRASFLSRITSNAEKLDRLLSDLLDLDRMDRGILEPRRRPTVLSSLVTRIVEQCGIGTERRVAMALEELSIAIDAPRVERIVENLLVNAMRHTPRGSRVWVSVGHALGGAEIVVADEGPGVPPALRRDVFEPFRQGPSAPSHAPGVGIGLSLVARFAEMHGGRAWVDERPGGGAAFHVFLPDGPAEPVADHRAAGARSIVGDVKAG